MRCNGPSFSAESFVNQKHQRAVNSRLLVGGWQLCGIDYNYVDGAAPRFEAKP